MEALTWRCLRFKRVFPSICICIISVFAEVQKAYEILKLQELQACLDKVAKTCVGNSVKEEGWFQNAQQVSRDVQELEQTKLKAQRLRDDDIVSLCRPPDQIISLLFATFILLGERQEGLDVSIQYPCQQIAFTV